MQVLVWSARTEAGGYQRGALGQPASLLLASAWAATGESSAESLDSQREANKDRLGDMPAKYLGSHLGILAQSARTAMGDVGAEHLDSHRGILEQ